MLIACAPSIAEPPVKSHPETTQATPEKMAFWDTPQRGANSFNAAPPDRAYFDALRGTGATWVRLTFSKWEGAEQDFLIGSADNYAAIPEPDLETLKRVLNDAHAAGLKVVLTPLSLPGARWAQHNEGKFDDRLWNDKKFWTQAGQFWTELAEELKDHPAIAAYNIVNEPAPEKTTQLSEYGAVSSTTAFLETHEGTPRHLLEFYNFIISEIRKQDELTPIMVDAGFYANPINLAAWPTTLIDRNVLYSVHIYEPYEATSFPNTKRETPLRYPGTKGSFLGTPTIWDNGVLSDYVGAAYDWAEQNNLPKNRIVIGEFGCVRTWTDCGTYLTDALDIFDTHDAHWAFYTFRPDEWDAMDYELPLSFKPGQYYWFIEEGRKAELPRNGALFEIIQSRIENQRTSK